MLRRPDHALDQGPDLLNILRFIIRLSQDKRLQCFDAVGWASGRASGLQKQSGGAGFAPDPTRRAYSAPQTPSCIQGPTSKRMGEERTGEEGRRKEGVCTLPYEEKEKSAPMTPRT